MAKSIKRKGWIEFLDGRKVDIYVVNHKSPFMHEFVTDNGVFVYTDNKYRCAKFYDSLVPGVPVVAHMYEVVVECDDALPLYDTVFYPRAHLVETPFVQFALFKPI